MSFKRINCLIAVMTALTTAVLFSLGCLMRLAVSKDAAAITLGVIVSTAILTVVVVIYVSRSIRIIKCCKEKNRIMTDQVNIMRDTLERVQAAYDATEKTHKAKSRFLNRMSHDLRTPMNAIMGYSKLMERSADDPDKVSHFARKISVAGQTLLELINDALDMSCIESGNVKLVEHEFSLSYAFEEVKNAIKPQIEEKHLSFHFYISNSTDKDRIKGDKQRFCQVLRNLLSNAAKYTPEGGSVDLIVNIMNNGDHGLQVLYQVKDTGCGMSRDFIRRAFLPFEREDNEQNTSIPGTGLGMCIAKSFVELMNGAISVESELGVGTLVTVRIPLSPVAADETGLRGAVEGEEILKGSNFLVAEDNESNAEIIMEVLKAMGAECKLTNHGQAVVEAFEVSAAGEYDMILMDIQMPIMDGYQAANAIRRSKHPDANRIAIVAMTADAFEEDVQRAFVSGMNGHLAKPLDLQAFINTVSRLKNGECVSC